jgi:hypothetical protein
MQLFPTSLTGGQWYSDTSPFSIPCPDIWLSQKKVAGNKRPSLLCHSVSDEGKKFSNSDLRAWTAKSKSTSRSTWSS